MRLRDHIKWMSDAEYFNVNAASYSILKNIDDEGPQALLSTKKKTGAALEFGSMVDTILTNPTKKDEIFYIDTVEKPTASLLVLADKLLQDNETMDISYVDLCSDSNILKTSRELKLWDKMSDEVLLSKAKNDVLLAYIQAKISSKGKIVTTAELKEAAEGCAMVLQTSDITKNLFIEDEDTEVLMQVPLFYRYLDTDVKGKLDLLRVDHKEKIFKPFDIKTGTALPSQFVDAFYYWRYYLQTVSYMLGIYNIILKIEEFKDYIVDDFKFIYISKKLNAVPCIYNVPESRLDSYMNGWVSSDGKVRRGFLDLLRDYKYYTENSIYDRERIMIENNNIINIPLI